MPNPAIVNQQSVVTGTGSPQTFTNPSSGVNAGNCIVMRIATFWGSGAPSPSLLVVDNETVPNTFTRLCGITPTALSACRVDLWASPPLTSSHAANGYTVTVTAATGQTSGVEIGGQMTECSGFGTIGVLAEGVGTAQTAASSSTASVTMASATTIQAVELIMAFLHFNDNVNPAGIGTPTGTGTWVVDGIQNNAAAGLAFGGAHQLTAATGTAYTATWSGLDTTTNNGGTALVVALYPNPGVTPPTLMGQACL